jgi:hypothetical protein
VFLLNKVDQVGAAEMQELREDFSKRIAKTLGKNITPKVFLVSAKRPDEFDLPGLRDMLSQQKSSAVVKQSIDLAGKQRERSMLSWLDAQRLPERVQRLQRLQREAEELASSRLGVPILENVVPRLLDDPQHRAAMVDEVMTARVARWPIVNVLHTLLLPGDVALAAERRRGAVAGGAGGRVARRSEGGRCRRRCSRRSRSSSRPTRWSRRCTATSGCGTPPPPTRRRSSCGMR